MKGLLIALVSTLFLSVESVKIAFSFDDLSSSNYLDHCGKRDLYLNSLSREGSNDFDPIKVVGGNLSLVGDHPWQLAMFRNGAFICAASLIDSYCAITAAHCTTVTNPSIYSLRRLNNRGSPESWSQAKTPSVLYNHPGYSSSTYKNDIAMFCFSDPFDLYESPDNVTFPVCLPNTDCFEQQRAIASGWGSTFSGGAAVLTLRDAYLPITTNAAATSFYGTSYDPITMIPAAEVGDGLDTCQGDSGGPLSAAVNDGASNTDMSHLKLCGITSWGRGCGNIGIYSRVYTYIDWIKINHRTFLNSIGRQPDF